MSTAPLPVNESERIEELRRYAILESPPEESFDRLTQLAAAACNVPIALVSLVDVDRQWFKSRVGFDRNETPRDLAFCAHTILGVAPFIVADARLDTRFADNPLVTGAPWIRFYAGVPLISQSRLPLGALCVIDHTPRQLDARELGMLQLIAEQISHELELRLHGARVQRKSALLTRTQRAAEIGAWSMQLRSRAVFWSDEMYRLHGLTPAGYAPTLQSQLGLYDPASARALQAAIEVCARHRTPFDLDVSLARGDGSVRWLRISIEPDAGAADHELIGVFHEIKSETAHQLSEAARRDILTGLASRTLFMEELEATVSRVRHGSQQRFAVLFLDVDRFKLVNETLGHRAGDELLKQITARLRTQLRDSDTSVHGMRSDVLSRFGGDEFLLLLNELRTSADAIIVAERILNALALPYDIFGSEVHSSASVGIVTSDESAASAEEVVRNADVAMYEAKRAGRACSVVFSESMHKRLARHVSIETSLRRAIGTAEIYVVYQPIIDLRTARVVSAEALLRWQHPTLGAISPAEFIPIAEESGLIIPVGRWVQQEACRALAKWRALDPDHAPSTISINLSRAELAQRNKLVDQLEEILHHSGLPAHCVVLEVTEREVMRDPEASVKLMKELRGMGIKLSMDDFGTGTSSLGVLRDYPFDTIKIDRSFVSDLPENPDVLTVIHAMVNLIENLGMTSLAEGVETRAQAAVLQSLGCTLAQGYLYSRPVLCDQIPSAIGAIAGRCRLEPSVPLQ
jgi:diguanylate cyclase (GGDEF)-like protein